MSTAVARLTNGAGQILADEFTNAAATLLANVDLYGPSTLSSLKRRRMRSFEKERDRMGRAVRAIRATRVWLLPSPIAYRTFSFETLIPAYSGLQNLLASKRELWMTNGTTANQRVRLGLARHSDPECLLAGLQRRRSVLCGRRSRRQTCRRRRQERVMPPETVLRTVYIASESTKQG